MKEKEINADTAALLARNYLERNESGTKKGAGMERAADRIVADWKEITVASVKRGRKDFTVVCELYEGPSSTTRTKHKFKVSKAGEIREVGGEGRQPSPKT
ncbi:MAG: hypothetical protein WED04_03165 [Promethearchaeati archaeon SRVP18_Atabeyarchaeia-1]